MARGGGDSEGVRLAELVAALSLGIDLGFSQPMEHVLRQCLIALRLAERLGVDEQTRASVYYTAMLINVGCHSDAHEQAKWFGDDIALKSTKYDYEPHTARELLAWVGLGDHLEARPATLSGGQQQRIAIARAVIARPRLLLADEPTGNVDDRIGLRLMRLFEELNKLGTTVVIATHNDSLVARFRHPQLRIADGRLHLMASDGAPVRAISENRRSISAKASAAEL